MGKFIALHQRGGGVGQGVIWAYFPPFNTWSSGGEEVQCRPDAAAGLSARDTQGVLVWWELTGRGRKVVYGARWEGEEKKKKKF